MKKPRQDVVSDEEEGRYLSQQEVHDQPLAETSEPTGPGKMKLMVTWNGEGAGGARPESRKWHGLSFEAGKAVSVEHLPPLILQQIMRDIDFGRGEWSYKYEVEAESTPPPPEAR